MHWRQEHPKINQLDIWTWGTTKCSVRHDYHAKPALAGRVERGAQVAAVGPRHSLPTAPCTVSAHVEALRLHVCQHVCAQDWPSILNYLEWNLLSGHFLARRQKMTELFTSFGRAIRHSVITNDAVSTLYDILFLSEDTSPTCLLGNNHLQRTPGKRRKKGGVWAACWMS